MMISSLKPSSNRYIYYRTNIVLRVLELTYLLWASSNRHDEDNLSGPELASSGQTKCQHAAYSCILLFETCRSFSSGHRTYKSCFSCIISARMFKFPLPWIVSVYFYMLVSTFAPTEINVVLVLESMTSLVSSAF